MSDRLDLSLVEHDLTRDASTPAGPMQWLTRSYEDPAAFWTALLGANGAFFPWPGKSRLYRKYDFYHDIIARNRQNPSPAFRWFRQGTGWQELDYRELGRLAAGKAARWEDRGVAAGQKLCIVSHLNEHFLVALLAALKIGVVFSLLPPWGASFLRRRIDAVEPDFVWTTEEHAPLLSEYRSALLIEGPTKSSVDGDDSRSHSYSGAEPFALCFDPTTTTPHVPRTLCSDSAYLGAIRDGAIALGLKPGQELSAPGFGLMETQPALLLACLLTGATYVHLDPADVARTPDLLVRRPLKAVGVSDTLREVLLQRPVEVGKAWDFWFRDPAESQDLEAWKEFVEALGLRDVFSGNQRWNASLGGCILFSVRRKGSPHRHVLPAAGTPWVLADPVEESRESLWGHGMLAIHPPGMEEGGIIAGGMLTAAKNEWIFIRPVVAGRAGRHYPAEEVLEVLPGLPHGSTCTVVEVPASRADGSSLFVLLVFVGGRRVSEASIAESFRKRILRELGKEFSPDVIQIVALHPRRGEDGSIDHEWCGKEYLSGGLARRTKGEVFQRITELRDLIHLSR